MKFSMKMLIPPTLFDGKIEVTKNYFPPTKLIII